MPFNIVKLELDPTGTNPDNKITDEPHILSNKEIRSLSPNYGPFFSNSVVVKEVITDSSGVETSRLLERNIDYKIVELHQEATVKYGKEISSVVLIINKSVSSKVLLTCQLLGGHYCYDEYPVSNMYQAILNRANIVKFKDIIGKPTEYPPNLHRHLLEDVYGFEAVVDMLERIRVALGLSSIRKFIEILEYYLRDFECKEAGRIYPSDNVMKKDAVLYLLSKKKLLSNVHIEPYRCVYRKGTPMVFCIDTINYPTGVNLYWEVFRTDREITSIPVKSGVVVSNNNKIDISTYLPTNEIDDSPVYLGVKLHPTDDEYIALSYKIKILPALQVTESDNLEHLFLYAHRKATLEKLLNIWTYETEDERNELLHFFLYGT